MKQLDLFNRCNPSQCSALSCRAEPATPQAIVLYSKSLRSLRTLRAGKKYICVVIILYVSRKGERGDYHHNANNDQFGVKTIDYRY